MRSVVIRWRDAIRDSDLDGTAKLVAFVLSTYMDASGETFVSKARLGCGASVTDRSVYDALKRIELAGLVEIVHSRGRTSNRYLARLPNHEAIGSRFKDANHEANDATENSNRETASSCEVVEIDRKAEGLVFQDLHQPCFLCERNGRPIVRYHGQLFCEPCLAEYNRPALAS
jgi:hypothetical protein